jgi:hypothetical protein
MAALSHEFMYCTESLSEIPFWVFSKISMQPWPAQHQQSPQEPWSRCDGM